MNPNTRKWLVIGGTLGGAVVLTKVATGKSWLFAGGVGIALAAAGAYWMLTQFHD